MLRNASNENTQMKRIGFIGLGNMGAKVAGAIAKHGYNLCVFDVNSVAVKQFEGIASIAKDTIEVLEKSEIIILSLPSSKIVEPMIESFIQNDISGKIIVDTSTSLPMSTQKLSERVQNAGAHMVDLPLSGSPSDAENAKLLAMFGGDPEMYEELRPVVECFADRYANLGRSGSGHVTKLIFNFIAMSYVNIYALAFPLAEKMGLDSRQIFDLLKTTGMGCGTMNFYAPKMFGRTYDMAFALELAHKDLSYVKSMFEKFQVPAFALDGELDLFRIGINEGKGKKDCSECISFMYDFFGLNDTNLEE